jgi:hypothetical protein
MEAGKQHLGCKKGIVIQAHKTTTCLHIPQQLRLI